MRAMRSGLISLGLITIASGQAAMSAAVPPLAAAEPALASSPEFASVSTAVSEAAIALPQSRLAAGSFLQPPSRMSVFVMYILVIWLAAEVALALVLVTAKVRLDELLPDEVFPDTTDDEDDDNDRKAWMRPMMRRRTITLLMQFIIIISNDSDQVIERVRKGLEDAMGDKKSTMRRCGMRISFSLLAVMLVALQVWWRSSYFSADKLYPHQVDEGQWVMIQKGDFVAKPSDWLDQCAKFSTDLPGVQDGFYSWAAWLLLWSGFIFVLALVLEGRALLRIQGTEASLNFVVPAQYAEQMGELCDAVSRLERCGLEACRAGDEVMKQLRSRALEACCAGDEEMGQTLVDSDVTEVAQQVQGAAERLASRSFHDCKEWLTSSKRWTTLWVMSLLCTVNALFLPVDMIGSSPCLTLQRVGSLRFSSPEVALTFLSWYIPLACGGVLALLACVGYICCLHLNGRPPALSDPVVCIYSVLVIAFGGSWWVAVVYCYDWEQKLEDMAAQGGLLVLAVMSLAGMVEDQCSGQQEPGKALVRAALAELGHQASESAEIKVDQARDRLDEKHRKELVPVMEKLKESTASLQQEVVRQRISVSQENPNVETILLLLHREDFRLGVAEALDASWVWFNQSIQEKLVEGIDIEGIGPCDMVDPLLELFRSLPFDTKSGLRCKTAALAALHAVGGFSYNTNVKKKLAKGLAPLLSDFMKLIVKDAEVSATYGKFEQTVDAPWRLHLGSDRAGLIRDCWNMLTICTQGGQVQKVLQTGVLVHRRRYALYDNNPVNELVRALKQTPEGFEALKSERANEIMTDLDLNAY